MLARVESRNPQDQQCSFVHYYDAIAITQWVYGDNFFVQRKNSLANVPDNRMPVNRIGYFLYNQEHNRFDYIGSSNDLFSAHPPHNLLNAPYGLIEPLVNHFIYSNKKKYEKMLNAGMIFCSGSQANRLHPNHSIAVRFLQNASQADAPIEVQRRAQFALGLMYYQGGNGIDSNYAMAIKFLHEACQVDAPIEMQRRAQFMLGIEYIMWAEMVIDRNYATAVQFLNNANQADAPAHVRAGAHYLLSIIEQENNVED